MTSIFKAFSGSLAKSNIVLTVGTAIAANINTGMTVHNISSFVFP